MFALERRRPMNSLDELFNRFLEEPFFNAQSGTAVQYWTPTADVIENENEIRIHLDLAGLTKENVQVELTDGNTLVIRGERKFEQQDKSKYHRVERFYGNFTRSFVLPVSVQSDKIAATFKDGVLEVVLPKMESAKSRKIQIQN